jgi:hypothetical protein
MGPYAGVDYNLTSCPLQSRLQHINHGQTYARVDFIPSQGFWIWPQLIQGYFIGRRRNRFSTPQIFHHDFMVWGYGGGGGMGTSQTVLQKCFHFTLGNQA